MNVLVRAAAVAGERTNRAELLAALATDAETDPDQLADLLRSYRRLPGDALDDSGRDDLPAVRAPGPRRSIA